MCWFSYTLWVLVAPFVEEWVSVKMLAAVLLSLCLVPMIIQSVSPEVRGVHYEHNLGATLRSRDNGTLQDSFVDQPGSPQRPREPVLLEAIHALRARQAAHPQHVDALLGAVVSTPYEPPALVVEGVSVASLAQGSVIGSVAQGEVLTGHVMEDDDFVY